MKINFLGSFAAGILLATTICGVVYFSIDSQASQPPVQKVEDKPTIEEPLTEEEMKAELQSSGYIVQTNDEYDKNMEEAKKAAQKEEPAKESKKVREVIFNVTEGMTSIDVGKILVEAKITDDAFKFTKAVEKKGLQNRLRPGLYKVDSEMSQDEVITTIFK